MYMLQFHYTFKRNSPIWNHLFIFSLPYFLCIFIEGSCYIFNGSLYFELMQYFFIILLCDSRYYLRINSRSTWITNFCGNTLRYQTQKFDRMSKMLGYCSQLFSYNEEFFFDLLYNVFIISRNTLQIFMEVHRKFIQNNI